MKSVVNFLLFQIAWWGSVLGAAAGWYWIGPPLALVAALVCLRHSRDVRTEIRLLLLVTCCGFLLDSALALAGVFRPVGAVGPAWLCPPWLLGLWLAFATTLRSSLGWLRGRPVLAAILGGPGGALAYLAGARLGALEFPTPQWPTLVILFVIWALVFPLVMALDRSSRRAKLMPLPT